jgi:chaperone required for assembly of F1-ATPase
MAAASGGRLRRFYKTATAAGTPPGEMPAGHAVLLDGKRLKTPAGARLALPNRGLAEALAAEWEAQEGEIRPLEMPLMRLVSTAIDRVAMQRDAVVDEIAGYGGTDLLCYRVDHPAELARRQLALWQPLVDWATLQYDAPLSVTTGILPLAQPPGALAALRAVVDRLDPFALTGLHAAVTACGSLILGLALLEDRITGAAACDAAQLEESWQIEQWGEDEEMAVRRAAVRAEIEATARYLDLLRT